MDKIVKELKEQMAETLDTIEEVAKYADVSYPLNDVVYDLCEAVQKLRDSWVTLKTIENLEVINDIRAN